MKEYKMVNQIKGAFKFTKDDDFIQELNNEARGGWRVVSVVAVGNGLKAFLERDR